MIFFWTLKAAIFCFGMGDLCCELLTIRNVYFLLQALQVADRLEAGTCFINTYNKTDVAAPFGGFKQSGFGKDLGK